MSKLMNLQQLIRARRQYVVKALLVDSRVIRSKYAGTTNSSI